MGIAQKFFPIIICAYSLNYLHIHKFHVMIYIRKIHKIWLFCTDLEIWFIHNIVYPYTFLICSSRHVRYVLQTVPTEIWVQILTERLKLMDCVKKGYVLEGFPQTREQALALQSVGIHPKHCGRENVYV